MFEKEGLVLGFISMMGNEVGAIFVRPDHHGKGIGRELMDFVADFHDELEVEVFERNRVGRIFTTNMVLSNLKNLCIKKQTIKSYA